MKKLILLFTTVFFLGCNLITESEDSSIRINTQFDQSRSLSNSLQLLTLVVSAPDMDTLTVKVPGNVISIAVPKGDARKFYLKAEFTDGTVYNGATTTDISTNTKEVNITLYNLLSSFDITKTDNPDLISDIQGTVIGNKVYLGLPKHDVNVPAFDISALNTTTVHTGKNGIISGNNYTLPVTYNIESEDGAIHTYTVETFETFSPKYVDTIPIGNIPAETEPGIDFIDGKVYMSYADNSNNPVLKSYNPLTGEFSENLFSYPGATGSPRFFKVTGTSENDLYFTYSSGTNLYVFHYNGTSWIYKTTHIITNEEDISLSSYNNTIYVGERTSSVSSSYSIYKYNPLADSSFNLLSSITHSGTDNFICVTNSIVVENENSIFVNVRMSNDSLRDFLCTLYYDGNTLTQYYSSREVTINPESIYSSLVNNGNVLVDIQQASSISTLSISKSGVISPLTPNGSAGGYVRSFYDGNDLYRTLSGVGPQHMLYKWSGSTWDSVWGISNGKNMRIPKVIHNNSNVFITYYEDQSNSTGNLIFIHTSK